VPLRMRSQARTHCSRSSATPATYADGSARTTMSTLGSTGSMSRRTISRMRRFTRLRSTAECEVRGSESFPVPPDCLERAFPRQPIRTRKAATVRCPRTSTAV
jgi:hypothetical protein